ncbi:unnamed protein product, partial [Mesorhabditis belari]|uniref:Phosphatidylinositol-glycan biosynthesis class W protein n=1 Tax=Mesorhabditis belari TaxID=2138241 RepID=A0AAF3J538_9BILA
MLQTDAFSLVDGDQIEVLMVVLMGPLTICLRNLFFTHILSTNNCFGSATKFVFNFSLLVVPLLLITTLLSDWISVIFPILLSCILLSTLFSLYKFYHSDHGRPSVQSILENTIEDYQPTAFVTYLRALVLIFTNIAILAVDFHKIFPTRFMKTIGFGHSLMDVGVAGFTYILGVGRNVRNRAKSDQREQEKQKRRLVRRVLTSSPIVLGALGFGRTVVLKILDYGVSVTEYGVHWNFFLTLFVIELVAKLLPRRFNLLFGILFAAAQQMVLSMGCQEWVLSDSAPRDNLFSANREGLCSLLGYIALYYLASAIGEFISKNGPKVSDWIKFHKTNCIKLFLFTFGLAVCLCVQMLTIVEWLLGIFHGESPWCSIQLCLLDSINRTGLIFFLIGNILTGVINMSLNPSSIDPMSSVLYLSIYMLICAVESTDLPTLAHKIDAACSLR